MSTIATNKRAHFDYELGDHFEAGLVLTGAEVKSAKNGHMSLKGSFVTMHETELFLTNANISPYPFAKTSASYDPTRSRKLLVKKSEIRSLIGKLHTKGLTLVPLRVYTKRRSTRNISPSSRSDVDGLIKLEFAVGRGKKALDKRLDIRKREDNRKIEKALKSSRI